MGGEAGQGLGLRVLQIHTRYREPGGEDTVAATEAALLRRAGHDVVQHAPRNPHGALAAGAALALSAWNPFAAREVAALVDRQRPDVAHVHNTWFASTVSVVAALAARGVPVVVTLHNYRLVCANAMLHRDGRPCEDCVGRLPWPAVRHRCYRGSLPASLAAATAVAADRRTWASAVDVFLVLSDFARERFVRAGLPAGRLRVTPNVVADPGPRPQPPSRSGTVVFAGRLSPEKGVDVLLDAWARAAPPGLELLVVGDGPARAALQPRAPAGVTFTGRLAPDEVSALLRRARAAVLPSLWYEGQPMIVLEAFSAGLPVVGSDLGGIPELLAGQGDGWLAAPGDADAWAAALARLRDDDLVDAAGAAARRTWQQRHSPEAGLRALEAAYAQAQARRRA